MPSWRPNWVAAHGHKADPADLPWLIRNGYRFQKKTSWPANKIGPDVQASHARSGRAHAATKNAA